MYLNPSLLRLFRTSRNTVRDLGMLAPTVALATVWAGVRHDAVVPAYLWAAPPTVIDWFIRLHVGQWFPVVVAALMYLTLLHVGTHVLNRALEDHPARLDDEESDSTEQAVHRSHIKHAAKSILAGLGAMTVAALALWGGPGNLTTQYVPLIVATVLALLVRWRRRKSRLRRLWQPTKCGFRPSWRPLVHVHRYQALSACDLADFVAPILITTDALANFARARDKLLTYRDPASAAWCVARAVEYCLQLGDLPEAERLLDEAAEVPALSEHYTVQSAKALFLHAVGQHEPALLILRGIRANTRRRTPRRLRDQIELIEANQGAPERELTKRKRRTYRRMAWRGQYDDIAHWVLLDARAPGPGGEAIAMAVAFDVLHGCEAVLNEFANDLDLIGMVGVLRAVADSWRLQGDCLSALKLHHEAAAAYMEAHKAYLNLTDRVAAPECLLRTAVETLHAGYPDPVRLLDLLRFGLHLLEANRTGIRHSSYRVSALNERHELYAMVFTAIADHLYLSDPERSGEICLWLIESQQRNALANAIRASGIELNEHLRSQLDSLEAGARIPPDHDFTAHVKDMLNIGIASSNLTDDILRVYSETFTAEALDLDRVLERLGGNCALLYDTSRDASGWSFRIVVVSPIAGMMVHTSRVDHRPADQDRSWHLTPIGILDALASGTTEKVTTAYNVPLDDLVWAEVADAVLPPMLIEVLRRHANHQPSPVLLVVPDGPISALPMSGLRLPDGSMLVDHAAVAFTPSLTLLSTPGPAARPATAAVHINTERLEHTADETRVWQDARSAIDVRLSDDRDGLYETLKSTPRPDIAVIATHGHATPEAILDSIVLANNSVLSASTAMSWPWPPTVLLGSCWTAHVRTQRGQEPLGFPIACLLGGAKTVVSALTPVNDKTAGPLLARLGKDVIAGLETLGSLRYHSAELINSDIGGRDVPPSLWATLTSWTSCSPDTPQLRRDPFISRYDLNAESSDIQHPSRASPVPGEPQKLRITRAVPLGKRTRETLAYASSVLGRTCVTTLDFVTAAGTVDPRRSADWTAFTVACGVADQPHPDRRRDEDTEALTRLSWDDRRILVSARLARAVELGGWLAADRGDPLVEPRHVLYGILAEGASDAARWLRSGVEPPNPADMFGILGDCLFSSDLPEPETLGLEPERDTTLPPLPDRPTTPIERLLKRANLVGFRSRLRRWSAAGIVVIVLVTGGFLRDMATARNNAQGNGFAGIVTALVQNSNGMPGTQIRHLVPGSPAELAGLANGDIVLAVDGYPRPEPADVTTIVNKHRPGDLITIVVRRDGTSKTFEVRLINVFEGLALAQTS